jgi:farnesyl-diphosphate farnesyltransferase
MTDMDWCRGILPRVSRTFALGIQMLPSPFNAWITTGYLLCRVVDTVEDTPNIDWNTRRRLFTTFEEAIQTGDCSAFQDDVDVFPDNADGELCRDIARVLKPMAEYPPKVQDSLRKWITEMSGGMALYARRHAFGNGRTTLFDVGDLDRYCYFVAGTVGHLLTDIFVLGHPEAEEKADELRTHAVGFGLLLQMTNIIKDVTDDWPRGWCFIPESVCMANGTTSAGLIEPDQTACGVAAVDQVNHHARRFYTDAVSYVLALPSTAVSLRRFCLFPMLLAGRTLELALSNTAVVDPLQAVKVTREVVTQTIAQVENLLQDEMALQALTLTGRVDTA